MYDNDRINENALKYSDNNVVLLYDEYSMHVYNKHAQTFLKKHALIRIDLARICDPRH